MPNTDEQLSTFSRLADLTREHSGTASVFECGAVHGLSNDEIIARFRADRAREYTEFSTRAEGLLEEVQKETNAGKFKFAELEEIEDDRTKLIQWLERIADRDFFPDERLAQARELLATVESACREFADRVYETESAASSAGIADRE